jgi:hypothetical protein
MFVVPSFFGFQDAGKLDPDYLAFYARVLAAGGSLTATEQTATNQLVLDLKANSLWTPMKAIYPMVGASAAACAQNLKSSSFTGTFTSGWTFASSGVNGNGSSAYFNTTFNPNTELSSIDSHISIYKNLGTISSADKINGVFSVVNPVEFSLCPDRSTTNSYFSYGNIGNYASPPCAVTTASIVNTGNGFYVLSRNATNFQRINLLSSTKNYNNVGTTTSSTNLPNDNFWLGAGHQEGTTTAILLNDYRYAFMSFGNYLDATQTSNFYTAVQAFQTTLSRQV